jgi:predicted secreted protein
VRSVYFALTLTTLLAWAVFELIQLLVDAIAKPVYYGPTDMAGSLSAAAVFAAAWAYHAWIRARDLREGTLVPGAAAWVSRMYLYGAAFVGVFSVLRGIGSLIRTIATQWQMTAALPVPAGDINGIGPDFGMQLDAWWIRPAVSALVSIAVWAAVWAGHWLYSNRLCAAQNRQGGDERSSRVRLAYFMFAVLWAAAAAVSGVAQGLGQLLANADGAQIDYGLGLPLWYSVAVPIVVAIPAIGVWWWHWRRAISEGSAAAAAAPSARRVADYVTAYVAISALASGGYQVLSAVFGYLLEDVPGAYPGSIRIGVGLGGAVVAVGGIVWVWSWLACRRRLETDRPREANSSARRFYLYFVLGQAVAAGAIGAFFLLLKAVRAGLGLGTAPLAFDVAPGAAILVVAGALIVFHAVMLRRDMAVPAAIPAAASAAADAGTSGTASSNRQEVVILGPVGVNLEVLRATLAGWVPANYAVEVRTIDEPKA